MKTQHTEGQWKIYEQHDKPFMVESDGDEWYALDYWIMTDKNRIIASTHYRTNTNNQGWPNVNKLAEMKSNARLITAAPDLLEALRNILPALGHYDDMHVEDQKRYLAAEKAIKKATEL